MSLLGWRGTKGTKGNYSVLFKGRGVPRSGELLLVDHNAKTVENIFEDLSEEKIEAGVDEMLKDQEYVKQVRAQEISLTQVKSNGKPVVKKIENYLCTKYSARYKMIIGRCKKADIDPFQIKGNYTSFESYFSEFSKEISNNQDGIGSSCFANEVESRISARKTATNSDASSSEENYEATVLVCNGYPLQYNQFTPLLHILGYASQHIAKFVEFLSENRFETIGFPLKVSVPLFCTVAAHLTLKNLAFVTPSLDYMNVDLKLLPLDKQELASGLNPEVKLYTPIIGNNQGTWKCWVRHSDFVEKEEIISPLNSNDRFQWSSSESGEDDESVLKAKQQFETLIDREDYKNDDSIENIVKAPEIPIEIESIQPEIKKLKEEPEEEFDDNDEVGEEFPELQNASSNIESHPNIMTKTMQNVMFLYHNKSISCPPIQGEYELKQQSNTISSHIQVRQLIAKETFKQVHTRFPSGSPENLSLTERKLNSSEKPKLDLIHEFPNNDRLSKIHNGKGKSNKKRSPHSNKKRDGKKCVHHRNNLVPNTS